MLRAGNRWMARVAAVVGTIVALGALPGVSTGSSCVVPGYGERLNLLWKPDMRAAIRYAHTRQGDIAFAVRTDHRFYGYRPEHVEWSASVVKAMLLVAYLDRPSVVSSTAQRLRRVAAAADDRVLGQQRRIDRRRDRR